MAKGFMYTTIWIVHTYLSLDQHSQIKISDETKAEIYSNNLNQRLKTAERMRPLLRGGRGTEKAVTQECPLYSHKITFKMLFLIQ